MKTCLFVLAAVACVDRAHATFDLVRYLGYSLSAIPYSSPDTTTNVCSSDQVTGWNFNDSTGQVPIEHYKGFKFSGFNSMEAEMTAPESSKMVQVRTLGKFKDLKKFKQKFFSGQCSQNLGKAPSFKNIKGFSIQELDASCTYPGIITMHYQMASGNPCSTASQCDARRKTISNTQYAGALKVSFVFSKSGIVQNALNSVASIMGICSINIHHITWNCGQRMNPWPLLKPQLPPGQQLPTVPCQQLPPLPDQQAPPRPPPQTVTLPGQTVTQTVALSGDTATKTVTLPIPPVQTVVFPGQTVTRTATLPDGKVTEIFKVPVLPVQTATVPGQAPPVLVTSCIITASITVACGVRGTAGLRNAGPGFQPECATAGPGGSAIVTTTRRASGTECLAQPTPPTGQTPPSGKPPGGKAPPNDQMPPGGQTPPDARIPSPEQKPPGPLPYPKSVPKCINQFIWKLR